MHVDCRSGSTTSSPSRSQDGISMESSYVEYLRYARVSVQNCVNACRSWSAPYDGEYPTVESFSDEHLGISNSDGNVSSEAQKDVAQTSQVELNADGVKLKECVYKRVQTAADDSGNATVSSFDGLTSATDDGIAKTEGNVAPSLAVSQLTSESITDDVEVDADVKQEQSQSELLQVSSSSHLDAAQSAVPPRHLSPVSTSDDLELFFRQLSHVPSKGDLDDTAVDILTEFDEVISQLETSSEDLDSQKTLTPEDHSAAEFPENIQPQTENDVLADENSDLMATVASSERTDNMQSSDDKLVEQQEEKVLDSSAGDDKDIFDSDGLHSKTSLFSSLLYCKYEPPYLPTVGMFTYAFIYGLLLESHHKPSL